MSEENKAAIRRLIEEGFNEDNVEVINELIAQDVVNHSAVPEHKHGIEGFRHINRWVRAAFSDIRYEIDDMIAEGDMVACRLTAIWVRVVQVPVPMSEASMRAV